MEKIKNLKPSKKHESDFFLRILAIIIAVIIWVVLSITQYPTTSLQIANVPVIFSLDGTDAESQNLSPVNLPDNLTVNVEIRGMKYEIGGYTEKDLIATVDLEPVTNEGTYSLDINVRSTHTSDQCTIVSVSPETIDVSFERLSTKEFDLSAETPYVTAEEQFVIKEMTASPSQIEIQGTEKEIEKIAKINAKVNDSLILSEDTTISTSELVFYDQNDNILPPEKYTIYGNKNFDVSFIVYKKKDLDLKVDFSGCPDNFDVTSIPYTLSEDKIQIITPDLDEASTGEKSIGTIPLNEVNLNKGFNFNLELNDGEELVSGSDIIAVSFNDNGYTSADFTIDSENFRMINRPTGKTVSVKTDELTDVTIIGPQSVIQSLSANDLTVQIDLKGVTSGTRNINATVYSSNYDNIWCYGNYQVQLTIS